MILFAILLTVVLAIAIFVVTYALAAGVGFIAVFGDIIVFALIVWAIVLIVKFFKREK